MQSRIIHAGGVFDVATPVDASTERDLAQFPTVGARPWPPGPRSSVKPAGIRKPVGYSQEGMGGVFGETPVATTAAVSRRIAPAPFDPRATMLNRVGPFDMTGRVAKLPGFTPKGGILDGATVGTGQPGGGTYFEAREPRVIGSGAVGRSLPDPMIALRNIRQESIMPGMTELTDARTTRKIAAPKTPLAAQVLPRVIAPRPNIENRCPPGYRAVIDVIEGPKCVKVHSAASGFGAMDRRPLPVSVQFAHPRMYGRSVFEGPVVGDMLPKKSLQPPFSPVSGMGAGPDGLGAGPDGSGCGCGGWKYSG